MIQTGERVDSRSLGTVYRPIRIVTLFQISHRMSRIAGAARQLSANRQKEMTMTQRLNPFTASPAAMQPWIELGKTIETNGLEPLLRELVMTRASQINGCTFCIHHHVTDARKRGETEERLYLLNAWRESLLYSDRERAALGWTEALTLVSETHAPDDVYDALCRHFTEDEQVELTLLIAQVNAWNRIKIGFRAVHPAEAQKAA
jgi:AhpD family alkylhydroperoxidase